jgi:hypothetical protein
VTWAVVVGSAGSLRRGCRTGWQDVILVVLRAKPFDAQGALRGECIDGPRCREQKPHKDHEQDNDSNHNEGVAEQKEGVESDVVHTLTVAVS